MMAELKKEQDLDEKSGNPKQTLSNIGASPTCPNVDKKNDTINHLGSNSNTSTLSDSQVVSSDQQKSVLGATQTCTSETHVDEENNNDNSNLFQVDASVDIGLYTVQSKPLQLSSS